MVNSNWVSLNRKIFNLDKVIGFVLESRLPYDSLNDSKPENVWDIKVNFIDGKSDIVATVSSEDKGLVIIEEILKGDFYIENRTMIKDPSIPKPDVKEEKNSDIPF